MDDELADRPRDPSLPASRRRIDRVRHDKLRRLYMQGSDPFPDVRLTSRSLAREIHMAHDPHELGPGEHRACRYLVAGRLLARRKHRHAVFLDLGDRSGLIELCVRGDRPDGEQRSRLLSSDIGDIVSVEGWIYVTDNHTLTLSVGSSRLLAKALRAPPAGNRPRDTQPRSRHSRGELELLASQRTRMLLETRSTLNGAIREWMRQHDFIELEGPVPRCSARQHLRRCLLGGLERVYDLGKRVPCGSGNRDGCPELTMLEWSTAYADCAQAAHQTQELIAHTAAALAADARTGRSERSVDLTGAWTATTVRDAILERCGIDVLASTPAELARCLPRRTSYADGAWDGLVCELYATRVEPRLERPTLVYDFPLAARELVKRHPADRRLASDFRVVVGGRVLAAGNGELNDPHEQWLRARERADSDEGTVPTAARESELDLLEYGMCPAASVELYVDRLLMLLTGGEACGM
jgi:lysyl-tRNA synthetase, class II